MEKYEMKIFRAKEYIRLENPTPGEFYRAEILTEEHTFKNLGGILGFLVPGSKVPYHYHTNRESIIIALSGEAVEIIDDKEITLKPGDVICISPGERHGTENRSDKDFRYLEFFTCPPLKSDFIKIK